MRRQECSVCVQLWLCRIYNTITTNKYQSFASSQHLVVRPKEVHHLFSWMAFKEPGTNKMKRMSIGHCCNVDSTSSLIGVQLFHTEHSFITLHTHTLPSWLPLAFKFVLCFSSTVNEFRLNRRHQTLHIRILYTLWYLPNEQHQVYWLHK